MAGPTKAQIEARLRELETENARLRDALEENARLREEAPALVEQPVAAPRPSRRGRAALGIVLIVLGTLLAPLATVVGFAARQASSTDTFVATLAPLAEDPAVQALIIDRATAAIDGALDTDALVEELLASVIDEGATPRLAAAADVLGPLLADQARVAIRSALTLVVESDAFATVWEQSLRLTHAQMVNVLEGHGDGAVAIDTSGVVAIQLEPIIAELKPALVDAGFTLAASIPEVDATITVAEVPAVAKARLGYSLLTTTSDVLAWTALGLIILGVVVHPRRPRAVAVAGVLLVIVGGALGLAIAFGGSVAAALAATQVPTDATASIYGALTGEIAAVMLAFVVLGAVAIVTGVLTGTSVAAAGVRRSGSAWLGRGSAALDARDWRPEGVPAVLRRHGWLVWVWLGLVLLLLFAALRPLTPGDVVLGCLILGVAAAVYGLLRGADKLASPTADLASPTAD